MFHLVEGIDHSNQGRSELDLNKWLQLRARWDNSIEVKSNSNVMLCDDMVDSL